MTRRHRARRVLAAGTVALVAAGGCRSTPTKPGSPKPARPASAIEKVVVLMQENRSFDSYFSPLAGQGRPGADGEPVSGTFHKTAYCEPADLAHSWTASHLQWGGGRMDGFLATNAVPADPTGSRAMGYYDGSDLPYYYDLFRTFATGDRYFSSVLGPTFPNRFYLLAGTSFGHTGNDISPAGFDQRSVFNTLDEARVSWKVYYSQVPFAFELSYVRARAADHVVPISQYYRDAAAGALPQVSFVDPIFAGPASVENDEHPPSNVQVGQRFVAGVVGALMDGPDWGRSALFLTYDEHGGYYDHVPPPPAPPPDDIAPALGPRDAPGSFDRYGFRVPVVVVSPYAKPGSVSHVVNDHTSILRFIEVRFGLPPLTHRDAVANPMLEFFDFSRPALATPPPLAEAAVDPDGLSQCQRVPAHAGP